MTSPMTADRLRRWFLDDALPLWWSIGADAQGGFHESLGQENGRPTPAPRRLRVQARQSAVYAQAGALGWNGPWAEACAHGLDFLLARYLRPDGLVRALVAPDGSVLDDTAVLYDQAFALYAMAEAGRALPHRLPELEAHALGIRAALPRNPAGGFLEAGARRYQSNPHMHLLEAALSWEATAPNPAWTALADEIATLAQNRFIDAEGGYLRECFAADWSPAPGPDGRVVEPGHQFEWAWLLERYARDRKHAGARAKALKLYEVGRTRGVDPARGVAFNAMDDTLAPLDETARLWPQTERIKAAALFAPEDVAPAVAGLGLYLDTAVRGLWFDRMRPDGVFIDEPAPASSFYHIAGAVAGLGAASAIR